jgi:hypothetical protein
MNYTQAIYKTHNGEITIANPETGGHRTFKINTARKGGLEGRRIVSLLDGPDNETSYSGFGFAEAAGVKVWRKKADSKTYRTYASMIEDPAKWEAKGLVYLFSEKCRVCNRKLTDPISIQLGIGPVCRAG